MNSKKQSLQLHRKISLTNDEFAALICALDYLLHCISFSYDDPEFDWRTVSSVADKADCLEAIYSKSELKACLAAIDISLRSLHLRDVYFQEVSESFPDLIPEIEAVVPILQSLHLRVHAYLSELQ